MLGQLLKVVFGECLTGCQVAIRPQVIACDVEFYSAKSLLQGGNADRGDLRTDAVTGYHSKIDGFQN